MYRNATKASAGAGMLAAISMTLVTALSAAGGTAVAAEWPNKPITMLIGYKAGGSTDTIGRVLATILGKDLGTKINVVNKAGAGGAVATVTLRSADPDGYTIYFATSSAIAIAPLMRKDLTYRIGDFVYGPTFHTFQSALVAPGDAPYSTLSEFVAYAAKHQPVKYASYSANTKMVMQVLSKKFGFEVSHVPVKGGGGVVPLILGKQVDISASGGIHAKYTASGKMKVLASLNSERLPDYPDVRTLVEDGVDVSLQSMSLIAFPEGTPQEIVARVDAAVRRATEHPDMREVMKRLQQPLTYAPANKTRASLEKIAEDAGNLFREVGFVAK